MLYSVITQGRCKQSGEVVALKKVALKRLEDGISEATIREALMAMRTTMQNVHLGCIIIIMII